MEPEQPGTTTRRQLIRGGVVLAGAAAAGVATADPAAAAPTPMQTESVNVANAPTGLHNGGAGPALDLLGADGPGLVSRSQNRIGVFAVSGTAADPNEPFLPSGVFGLADQAPGVAGQGPVVGVLGRTEGGPIILDINEPFLPAGVFGHANQGVAVAGHSNDGVAVVGDADAGTGVIGHSDQGTGVFGHSSTATGVMGHSFGGTGIIGIHTEGAQPGPMDPNDPFTPAGVFGLADEGTGILGRSLDGTGIVGVSHQPGSPGVEARNLQQGGVGLQVEGRIVLSSVGQALIPKHQDVCHIVRPIVTPNSQVFVTLLDDPGADCSLQRVQLGNGAFDVFLTRKAKKAVRLLYLVTG